MTEAPARPSSPPDVARWPGLHVVPTGPRARVSVRIARRLFMAALERLDVTVHVEGRTICRGGPEMTVHQPEELWARLGRHQLIGFGEAYLTGAWDAEDLGGFLTVLAAEMADLVPKPLQTLRALVVKRPPSTQRSSRDNSRNNIAHHYDLSNDLFRLFLDETLSYSAALWDTTVSTVPDTLNGRPSQRLQAAPPGTVATDSLA